jgi:bla regulator protein blaR1
MSFLLNKKPKWNKNRPAHQDHFAPKTSILRSPGSAPATGKDPHEPVAPVGSRTASSADYLRLVALIWGFGSAAFLIWFASRAWRFHQFLGRAGRHDEEFSDRVARLARGAGLASAPRVLLLDSAISPMLWGLGRGSRLLFPAELARRIDSRACDALLLHELAHYARGDGLVRFLELMVHAAYWWHPLVGWARREIEAAEEACCDAWVVAHQAGPPRLYAEALLATLDFLSEPLRPMPPAACGLGQAPLLRSRLTQIMCGEVAPRPSRAARALVLAAAALVLPLAPAFVGEPRQKASAHSTPPSVAPPAALVPLPQDVIHRDVASSPAAPNEADPPPLTAPRSIILPRIGPVLYAAAVSPNGKYKLEARTGYKSTLINLESDKRLDLSAHRILCASFSPDSGLLATGHEDSLVRIWDNQGGLQKSLKGSEAAIASVAFARDGRRVAAGADDGSVLIWDVQQEDEVARLPRQDAPVSCLRWSSAADRLAIALGSWSDRDRASLVIWQPSTGDILARYLLDQPVAALNWLAGGESLMLAEWDGRARMWNLAAGANVTTLWLDKDLVSAAAWSTDCPLPTTAERAEL